MIMNAVRKFSGETKVRFITRRLFLGLKLGRREGGKEKRRKRKEKEFPLVQYALAFDALLQNSFSLPFFPSSGQKKRFVIKRTFVSPENLHDRTKSRMEASLLKSARLA